MVLPCAEWWREKENRATTSFGYCSSMASLPVWAHCANARWIRCQAYLNSFPLRELEETTRKPPYYVDEGYTAGPEINQPLPERSSRRGTESPTLETDVYVWRYTLRVAMPEMTMMMMIKYNKLLLYAWKKRQKCSRFLPLWCIRHVKTMFCDRTLHKLTAENY